MVRKSKKEQRNKIIIGGILIIFLVSSIGSFLLYYNKGTANADRFTLQLSNGNYEFARKFDSTGNLYYDVNSGDFAVFYLPSDLAMLNIDENAAALIQNSPYFYFTFDPNQSDLSYMDYLRFDIRNNIPSSRYVQDAITQPSPIYDLPIITCNNATPDLPVIMARNSTYTNITVSGNCINVDFVPYDILRVRDLLIYLLHGVTL